jgi:hypothetical protein
LNVLLPMNIVCTNKSLCLRMCGYHCLCLLVCLSIFVSLYLKLYVPTYVLPTYYYLLTIYQNYYLSIYLSSYLLSTYLPIYLFIIYLPIYLIQYLLTYLWKKLKLECCYTHWQKNSWKFKEKCIWYKIVLQSGGVIWWPRYWCGAKETKVQSPLPKYIMWNMYIHIYTL